MSKKGTGIPQNNALSDVDYRELSMMQQAIFDGGITALYQQKSTVLFGRSTMLHQGCSVICRMN